MKKSLIGLGVIAALAVGGAANAGAFLITGGQAPIGTPTFSSEMLTGTSASAGLNMASLTGSGLQAGVLTQGNADSVATALGVTGQNASLTYFGVKDGDKGYFGVLFIGHGGSFQLNMQNSSPPSEGVYSTGNGSGFKTETLVSGTYTYNEGSTVAGQAYLFIFTQLDHQASIGGNGWANDSNMTVRYMTYSGGSWSAAHTTPNVASSALNMATFIVPVPAPALLAGLGLAGALALRRRMK